MGIFRSLGEIALVAALSAGCSTHYVPIQGPHVSTTMEGGSLVYVRDGQKFAHGFLGGGLVDAVGADPEAREAAETYHSRNVTSLALSLVGLACLVGGSVYVASQADFASASSSNNDSSVAVGAGALACALGTVVAGSIVAFTAIPYQFDALNIYNDNIERRRMLPLLPPGMLPMPPPGPPPPTSTGAPAPPAPSPPAQDAAAPPSP
jgi:hypothetical protein